MIQPRILFFSDGIGTRKILFDPGGVWILRGFKSGGWVSKIQSKYGLACAYLYVIIILIYQFVEWNVNIIFLWDTTDWSALTLSDFSCDIWLLHSGALLTSPHLAWKNVVRWFYNFSCSDKAAMDELMTCLNPRRVKQHTYEYYSKFLREATYTYTS